MASLHGTWSCSGWLGTTGLFTWEAGHTLDRKAGNGDSGVRTGWTYLLGPLRPCSWANELGRMTFFFFVLLGVLKALSLQFDRLTL